jgi:hypothetical protein
LLVTVNNSFQPASEKQIVGVVADAKDDGIRSPIKPAIYVPYSLHTWMWTQILAKTSRRFPRSRICALGSPRSIPTSKSPTHEIFTPT